MEFGPEKVDPHPLTFSSSSGEDSEQELKMANIFYMVTFIVFAIICFIFYNTGYSWIGKVIKTVLKGKFSLGASLVARTTSVLAIWFFLHALLTIGNKNLVDSCQFLFHTKWKSLHDIVLVGVWIGFWFVPDPFFNFYMKFAMVISIIYMLLQIYFLVIFFHDLNDKWATDDNMCYLFVVTVVLEILSLIGFGLAYWMFKDNKTETIAFTTTNLIISIALFVFSIFIEHGSIFTSSLISCYIAFLTWSGLMCERNTSSKGASIAFSIIASIFTLAWCGYSAFTTSGQFDDCQCEGSQYPKFSIAFFHSLFGLASIYVTMIVTHWGQTESDAPWTTARGSIAKWVNISSSWIVAALYFWTLIAPCVCPNRDFS